jgi:hypothetical protein
MMIFILMVDEEFKYILQAILKTKHEAIYLLVHYPNAVNHYI